MFLKSSVTLFSNPVLKDSMIGKEEEIEGKVVGSIESDDMPLSEVI